MARAVSPWTWRRALRNHGPESPSVLLTLYTIGTYMDRNGYAYPGQAVIAVGARTSARTVRRHIATAERLGWLSIELAGRGGQGWRHNAYRAAVPDGLQLDNLDEEIADHIVSDVGDVHSLALEGEDTAMSARPPSKGEDTIVSPRRYDTFHEREDIGDAKVRTSGREGEDTRRQKVRTQLCPTNSRSETPALRTPAPEEARDTQSRVASTPPRDDHKERSRKAAKHLAADPRVDNATLQRAYGLSDAEVQKLRRTAS